MTIFRTIIEKFKKETFEISDFHSSINQDDDEKFYWYLKNRINKQNINLPNASGNTALHHSCTHKNIEFIKALLNAGARANVVNSREESPLLNVCSSAANVHKAYMDIMPIILNPNLRQSISPSKYQAILELLNKNVATDLELSQMLIAHHADVNVVDKEKNTCLHYAMKAEHSELVLLLIENGANLLCKNEDDETPFDWALKDKSYEALDAVFRNTKTLDEINVFIHETQKNPEVYAHYQEMLNSIQIKFSLDNSLEEKNTTTKKIKI